MAEFPIDLRTPRLFAVDAQKVRGPDARLKGADWRMRTRAQRPVVVMDMGFAKLQVREPMHVMQSRGRRVKMADQRDETPAPMHRPASFADQVYGRILDGILAGEFPTGSRLPSESRLGEIYGVSRPVVREALARLQRDGLLEIRKGSGSHVRASPPADLSSLTNLDQVARYQRFQEFRLVIEGAGAALAAERRDEAGMARIQAAQDAFVAEIRAGRFLWRSDKALHLAVAEASGNEFFARSLEEPELELGDFMNVSLSLTSFRSPERGEIVIREHAGIVDAIRSHDSTGARVAMEHHLLQSRKRMLDRTLSP